MARNMYGATSADFTLTSGGRVVPGATLTIWSARTGGTQITDLLDRDSVACTTVTSAADGSIVYYGPNNDKTVHWADSGQGSRVAIRPTDITGDPPVMSIGTVGTGTAAASLTGTSEAPVLNLTLPTAGANGVNTAAIQDGAVTAAKIADGTITSTDVAASTFAAFGTVGNLLTAATAACTSAAGFNVGNGTLDGYPPVYLIANGVGDAYLEYPVSGLVVGDTYTFYAAASISGDHNGTPIISHSGDSLVGTPIVPNTGPSVQRITFVATSTTAALYPFYIAGASSGDVGAARAMGLWKGAGGQWALPGTPITNTGIRPNPSNTAEVQIWNDATATWITV